MLATRVFGADHRVEDADDVYWHLSQGTVEGLPELFVTCGTEDLLIDENRRFVAACEAVGVPVTSSFGHGHHDWDYWDANIRDALRFFAARRKALLELPV